MDAKLAAALLVAMGAAGCAAPDTSVDPAPTLEQPVPVVSRASRARLEVTRGLELLAERRVRAAQGAFLRALALDPQRYDAHHGLGRCHYEAGDYELEQVEYQKCLALNPRYAEAWRSLGNARFSADDLSGAQAAYERYLALAPGDAAVTFNLAQIAEDLGQREAAKALYARSAKLSGSEGPAPATPPTGF